MTPRRRHQMTSRSFRRVDAGQYPICRCRPVEPVPQGGRHVDAIAEQIVAFDHYIREIDANANDDALVWRDVFLVECNFILERDSAVHRIHSGIEYHERTGAYQFYDTPAMGGNCRVEYGGLKPFDRTERTRLVDFNQARITDDICGHNRRKPSFDAIFSHPFSPMSRDFRLDWALLINAALEPDANQLPLNLDLRQPNWL